MPEDLDARRELGERRMKARDFPGAIEALSSVVQQRPDDLRALLRLGICHLLHRGEQTFVAIHGRARRIVERLGALPDDLARLWAQYERLFARLAATALVAGAVALPGCTKTPPAAETVPALPAAADVAAPAEPADAGAAPAEEVVPPAATTADAGTAPAQEVAPPADAATPETEPVVQPAHRYSGGVRPPQVAPVVQPAHRYSGGVRPGSSF